jgi:Iron-containing redox enzyme
MSDTEQHRLFVLNRGRPTAGAVAEIERIEAQWIAPRAAALATASGAPADRASLFGRLDELLVLPDEDPPEVRFVAEECGLAAFRTLVAEFAVDALTEAQSFLPIVARLPMDARMPVFRVLVDEFGCGNLARSHSQLYVDLLDELDLPTGLDDHLPAASREVLAFVNLFYWLAARADSPAWFLGALAHLEASIVDGFRCYVRACERLGVEHDGYYREHIHIDGFHRREMRTAMVLLDRHDALDHAAAWAGAQLAGSIFDTAFSTAVDRARAAGQAAA